jgi:ribose 5-phosphate isomerase B
MRFLQTFLNSRFSGDPRHQRRIDMLTEYQATGRLPALPAAPIARRAHDAAPNT